MPISHVKRGVVRACFSAVSYIGKHGGAGVGTPEQPMIPTNMQGAIILTSPITNVLPQSVLERERERERQLHCRIAFHADLSVRVNH